MNTSIKNISKVLATAALLASAGFAQAGTATADLGVTASITAKCTISANAVEFGSYDPVVTNGVNGSNNTNNCTKSEWIEG